MKSLSIAVLLIIHANFVSAATTAFENTWERGWMSQFVSGRCLLTLDLQGYGRARFVGSSETGIEFEMQAARDFQGGPLTVRRETPAWSPMPVYDLQLGKLVHIRDGGSTTDGELARQMFLALRQGYELVLHGPANTTHPDGLALRMRALEFFPAMQNFLDCAHTSVSVDWHDISRTRVAFDVNKHGVENHTRLDALASYVRNNPAVTQIYIDGYTDATGSDQANHQLAKRRAKAVAAYLKTKGLGKVQVIIRHHGERYPVASNENAEGRARNRRATVRLEKQTPPAIATK